jgi:hypothetical protein
MWSQNVCIYSKSDSWATNPSRYIFTNILSLPPTVRRLHSYDARLTTPCDDCISKRDYICASQPRLTAALCVFVGIVSDDRVSTVTSSTTNPVPITVELSAVVNSPPIRGPIMTLFDTTDAPAAKGPTMTE